VFTVFKFVTTLDEKHYVKLTSNCFLCRKIKKLSCRAIKRVIWQHCASADFTRDCVANKTAKSRLRHTRVKTVDLILLTHFQSPVNYQFFLLLNYKSDLFTLCEMSPLTITPIMYKHQVELKLKDQND